MAYMKAEIAETGQVALEFLTVLVLFIFKKCATHFEHWIWYTHTYGCQDALFNSVPTWNNIYDIKIMN